MAAKKTTVAQLSAQLADMVQSRKTDDSIALWLKDVELTEQLTTPALNSLLQSKPGPLTIGQLLLLFVDSSLLPPPTSDLPTQSPPPGQDAQTALLHRAQNYVAQDVARLPRLVAQKQTLRFQNSINYVRNNSGNGTAFSDPSYLHPSPDSFYLSLQDQQTEAVISENGIELQPTPAKKKVPGPNGQSSEGPAGLPIGAVLADAKDSISWLRWETVNGRQTAVFSFSVAQKNSHYKVNYCCFPSMEHVGSGMHFASNTGSVSTFSPFTASPGYHGELFIDSVTGIIVRLITKADLKPTDFVLQEDIRVDYSAVLVADKHYIVPTQSMMLTTVAPNGDSYVQFAKRRILFDVNYSKFQLTPAQSPNPN